jgi:hypothetical protein
MTTNYVKRTIEVIFILLDDVPTAQNAKPVQKVDLSEHRVMVQSDALGGGGIAYQNLTMKVWGMRDADMNFYGYNPYEAMVGTLPTRPRWRSQVLVGDENNRPSLFFDGCIISASANYGAMPEVTFDVLATSDNALNLKLTPARTYAGRIPASQMIDDLAREIGMASQNHGLNTILTNQVLNGSLGDRIKLLAQAAQAKIVVGNGRIDYWPLNTGPSGDRVIHQISPETGLVSYPAFSTNGITVKVVANPQILIGHAVKLKSAIKKAAGFWTVSRVHHELSTYIPNGPWFTTVELWKTPADRELDRTML